MSRIELRKQEGYASAQHIVRNSYYSAYGMTTDFTGAVSYTHLDVYKRQAIHQRIQKLTNLGISKGSEYVIDPEKIGYETCAYIGIYLKAVCLLYTSHFCHR